RNRDGLATGNLLEAGVPGLERHRAPPDGGLLAVGPHLTDQWFEGRTGLVEGEEIDAECRLGADGLTDAIGADRSFVDAPRAGVVVGARLSELLLEEWQCLGPEVAALADPEPLHLRARHGSDPVEPADGEALDKSRAHPRGDDEQAVGLALVGR